MDNLFDKALELKESGNFNQAIELLIKGINLFSDNANMLALLSHCFILIDDLTKAKFYLDKAKEIDPKNALVCWNEARLLLKNKDFEKAVVISRNTNNLFPNNVEGLVVLGSCLRAIGSIDESLLYFNKATTAISCDFKILAPQRFCRLYERSRFDRLVYSYDHPTDSIC